MRTLTKKFQCTEKAVELFLRNYLGLGMYVPEHIAMRYFPTRFSAVRMGAQPHRAQPHSHSDPTTYSDGRSPVQRILGGRMIIAAERG